MRLKLLHAGRYDFEQSAAQITHAHFLSLNVSGLIKSTTYTPDGKIYLQGNDEQMQLTPPGCKNEFSYSAKRENFVLICDIPELVLDENSKMLQLNLPESTFRFAPALKLDHTMTMHYRRIFERIIHLKSSPVPANIFMAEQLTAMLLGEIASAGIHTPDSDDDKEQSTIAWKLKKMLDNDVHFSATISDMCRKLGYSPEHARRTFLKHFGIDPQEYRLRRKLDRICLLLQNQELSIKEIASEVGMKNVTHLHAFIRQKCGTTPRELLKKLSH